MVNKVAKAQELKSREERKRVQKKIAFYIASGFGKEVAWFA